MVTKLTTTFAETGLPLKSNKWIHNEQWKANNTLRLIAKVNGEMFYTRTKSCKNGHFKRYVITDKCVICSANGKAKSKKENPIHAKKQKTKHHLKFSYGITIEEYEALLLKQNNLCFICQEPETATIKGMIKKLAVDHCHSTKKVRGLLCLNCNMGIGKFKHNPELLRNAALYCEET